MTWAFRLDLKPATAKFVLVAIADNADDEGRAFPSISALVAKTSLDRKTVIHALDQLEQRGLLQDTGQRVGRTGQVKVYSLVMEPHARQVLWDGRNSTETGPLVDNTETVPDLPKDSVNGTVETVPKIPSNSTVFPSKGTVFPPKESQKRDTESSGNRQKESSKNLEARTRPRARRVPEDFRVTEQMRAWAARTSPSIDIDRETEAFRDHQFRDAHSDWEAAWRQWMRRAPEFKRNARPPSAPETKLTWRPPPDEPNAPS